MKAHSVAGNIQEALLKVNLYSNMIWRTLDKVPPSVSSKKKEQQNSLKMNKFVIVSNTQELRKWVNFCLEVRLVLGTAKTDRGAGASVFRVWALRWKSWEVGEVLCVWFLIFHIEVFPRAFRVWSDTHWDGMLGVDGGLYLWNHI